MDNIKIQNPGFEAGNLQSPIFQFLDAKLEKISETTDSSTGSAVQASRKPKKILPDFQFKFGGHSVGESVEYEVVLVQKFKVFNRTISEQYKFKTQYSKLEKLSQKLGAEDFPGKKWFGNKDQQFIQKRKHQLQNYLNKMAKTKSTAFLEFVLQIKQATLAKEFRKGFKL